MRQAFIVVDLGFGDAGKGTVVDWLSRRFPDAIVVRFNGGPQAAHNVVTPEGKHHTFSQFGSGMLVAGVSTHLSKHVLINPLNMWTEAQALAELG
jgi:adenylosuccinate synthase